MKMPGKWVRHVAWVGAPLLVAILASLAVNGRSPKISSQSDGEPYRAGDRFADESLLGGRGQRAVVIVLNTACYYCGTSGEFLRELADYSLREPSIQVLLVSAEPVDVVQRYAARHRIHPAQIASLPRDQLRVKVVPTILVVDTSGTIERIWTGEPTQAARALILASLRQG